MPRRVVLLYIHDVHGLFGVRRFRACQDRFQDVSSYRKGRCRREENEYRDLGPGKYDRPSMMELQQARSKTMGR